MINPNLFDVADPLGSALADTTAPMFERPARCLGLVRVIARVAHRFLASRALDWLN
jgi:hypothetical protein